MISSEGRRARAQSAIDALCLPNAELVSGAPRFKSESEVPLADRQKFGNGTFASLSLGEIAIHLSHRKALDQCLNVTSSLAHVTSGPQRPRASSWRTTSR